ncbi:MAG: hypothetical protein J5582_15555 [Ruminococcus sp.]|uniref:hypothetical protein n=1 Tax=Ruminococcus sp. TaxID=41978 RepID=UPI0025F966BB|nr:hypothetical protein [Ruminococcus sp.]MBO4867956.1 hypothetical protein [Ruminococcus sp.]
MYETTLNLIGANSNEGNNTEYHWQDDDFFDALMKLDTRLESINFSQNDVAELTIRAK